MNFKLIMQLSSSSENISQELFLHHFNTDLKHLYCTLHSMCIWCLPTYFDSSRQVENLANPSDKIFEHDLHIETNTNVDATQMLMLLKKINQPNVYCYLVTRLLKLQQQQELDNTNCPEKQIGLFCNVGKKLLQAYVQDASDILRNILLQILFLRITQENLPEICPSLF